MVVFSTHLRTWPSPMLSRNTVCIPMGGASLTTSFLWLWTTWTFGSARVSAREILLQSQKSMLSITRSEEHTSELQSPDHLVCRLLLEKKKKKTAHSQHIYYIYTGCT